MRYEAPEQQRAFYHSSAWQKCRTAYIASVNRLCEQCLAKGIVNPGYIVHHKQHIDVDNIKDPEILLSFDNLEYLCLTCHNREHFKRKRRYEVRVDGSVVPV